MLHDGQLAVKQTDKLSAELIALILDLELLFIVGNVVDYCIDLCCFLFNLLVEIFTLCLLLSKLTFDLSHFSIESFYLILMLAVLLDSVAVTSGLLRFTDLNTVFSTNIAENSPLLESPAVDRSCIMTEVHFLKSFRHSIPGIKTSVIVTNRNVVDMQVRRCFIEVHHRIEHIEIRISFLETLHVFFQASDSNFRIGSADTCIVLRADLHQVFIEALLLVRSGDNALARLTVEQVQEVVVDHAILSFLMSVVSLYSFIEKLVVSITQILLNEHDVIRSSGRVDVLGSELPVVM